MAVCCAVEQEPARRFSLCCQIGHAAWFINDYPDRILETQCRVRKHVMSGMSVNCRRMTDS